MNTPECPVCGALEDCAHCLVEWQTDVGVWQRGQMTRLLQRLSGVASQLLSICLASGRPPRNALLLRRYQEGRRRLNRGEDLADLLDDMDCEAQDFLVECLCASPGGVQSTTTTFSAISRNQTSEWVTLWAQNPDAVRLHLLDAHAALEVDLEKLQST